MDTDNDMDMDKETVCGHDSEPRINSCFDFLTHSLFLTCTEGKFYIYIYRTRTYIYIRIFNVHELFR
jgi:hypothetical protein